MPFLSLLILAPLHLGCHSASPSPVAEHPNDFIRISQSFRLTEAELEELRRSSFFDQNADAAWRVRNHYRYFIKDIPTSDIWLKCAAQLGHLDARRIIDERRYRLTHDELKTIYPAVYNKKWEAGTPVDIWDENSEAWVGE